MHFNDETECVENEEVGWISSWWKAGSPSHLEKVIEEKNPEYWSDGIKYIIQGRVSIV